MTCVRSIGATAVPPTLLRESKGPESRSPRVSVGKREREREERLCDARSAGGGTSVTSEAGVRKWQLGNYLLPSS